MSILAFCSARRLTLESCRIRHRLDLRRLLHISGNLLKDVHCLTPFTPATSLPAFLGLPVPMGRSTNSAILSSGFCLGFRFHSSTVGSPPAERGNGSLRETHVHHW